MFDNSKPGSVELAPHGREIRHTHHESQEYRLRALPVIRQIHDVMVDFAKWIWAATEFILCSDSSIYITHGAAWLGRGSPRLTGTL